jgi:beta propeller repeat protein
MKKVMVVCFSLIVCLGSLLAEPVAFPICTENYPQRAPKISGKHVVWLDLQYQQYGSVCGKDLETGTLFSIGEHPVGANTDSLAISGDIVIWSEERDDVGGKYYDIYGYNLSSAMVFPIVFSNGQNLMLDIDDSILVWGHYRNSNIGWAIYGKDLVSGQEFPVAVPPSSGTAIPKISGDFVVWQDWGNPIRGQDSDLYGRYLSSGTEFPICIANGNQDHHNVNGNTVVWQDNRNEYPTIQIHGYDLVNRSEFLISENGTWPDVDGNIVVWASGSTIWGKNLKSGTEFKIAVNCVNPQELSLSGDTVVWEDYRNGNADIYGATVFDIAVLAPNGGESLVSDSKQEMIWKINSQIPVNYVRLEFSSDSGQSWETIDIVENTGTFNWTVPHVLSKTCLVKISNVDDPKFYDISDAPFSIEVYSGGSGTLEDPYQIRTAEHMSILSRHPDDWGKHFKLMTDIDLGDDAYKNIYIGQYAEEGDLNHLPFLGSFDGNGKTLSNYRYTGDDVPDYVGLFSYLGSGGQIRNLTLEAVEIATPKSSYVGGLVGLSESGTVTGCRVQGGIIGKDAVGGIVGLNWQGTISNCRVGGEIRGQGYIGGLIGYGYGGSSIQNSGFQGLVTGNSMLGGIIGNNEELSQIKQCYSTGLVKGGSTLGGITGGNYFGSLIEDSYSLCDVIGQMFLGGLVGVNDFDASVTRSYSAGLVSGNLEPGGLIGIGNGNATNSFWDVQTSGQAISAGGVGKATYDMRLKSTFTDAGWDFVGETGNGTKDLWKNRQGLSYPRLTWVAESPYDFMGDYGVSLQEFALLADYWQTNGCQGFGYWCSGADLDHSGSVDLNDLLILTEHWMTGE